MAQRDDQRHYSRGRSTRYAVAALAACGAVLVPAALTSAAAAVPVATHTAVTVSATASHPYQPVTATATVTPATAAGTVTFTRAGGTLCSASAVAGGTAHCTFTPTVTSAAAAVTAAFTPTDATLSVASTGTSPTVTVGRYPVTVRATYSDDGTATCAQRAVSITVTRAAVSGSAPTSALPVPAGTVSVGGAAIALPASGKASACVAVTTAAPVAVYSGDARYLGGQATATAPAGNAPNHTRTGSTPGVVGSGSGSGGLANTASTHVEPLVITALGLLLAGIGCVAAGRRRASATRTSAA